MGKSMFITMFFGLSFIVSCNVLNGSTDKRTDTFVPDSYLSRKAIISDSIDKILVDASEMRLYLLQGLVRDTAEIASEDSVFNYPISKYLGAVSDKDKNILEFIVCDTSLYKINYDPVRQPFNPNFCAEFKKGGECVYYFVSFGTEEVAIADETGHFVFYLMTDVTQMRRWYERILINMQ